MKVFALWKRSATSFQITTELVALYEKEKDAETERDLQNNRSESERDPVVDEVYFIRPQNVILGSGSILSAVQDWVIEVLNEEKGNKNEKA